jgi:DNA-binding CsgD family transcriptional regulator
MRSVAYDEAISHLLIAERFAAPGSAERVDILLDIGAAQVRNGLERDGTATFGEAFRAAHELGLVDHVAQAAVGFLEAVQLPGGWGGEAVKMLSRALALLGDEETPTRARLQAALARGLVMSGDAGAGATLEASLAAARRLGDAEALIFALQSALTAEASGPGRNPGRYLSVAREVVALAKEVGDAWAESYARGCVILGLLMQGDVAEARVELAAHRRAADRARFVLYRYQVLAFDAIFALIDGRLDAAERFAEDAHEFGAAVGSDFDAGVYGVQMYVIRREQGRLAEVAPALRFAARMPDQPLWRPGFAAALAETGLLEEARRELDRLAPDGFGAVARDAMWPGSLGLLAEACLAVGDAGCAPQLYDDLAAFRGQTLMAGFTVCLGPAERLMGGLAALMGRDHDARAHFEAALALAERSGSPLWRAQVRHDWAVNDPSQHQLLGDALAIAEAFGLRRSIDCCRAAISRVGRPAKRPAAMPGAPPPAAAMPTPPDGLSAREVEVLRLVAEGLSNRRIGEQLFISANTAANHVRSILQKTGCANRAEATAYAARHGLLER